MSMPGWYPDPAGNPGHFRYWDGSSWSQQTTTDPAREVPGRQGDETTTGRRGVLGLLLGGLAAILVLALLVWAVFFRDSGFVPVAEDTNSASPTGPVWNETDTPTPTPSGVGVDQHAHLQAVGAVSVADGFEEPRTSAYMMMSCFATSGYYSGFSGRKDLSSQAVTIDGHKGWHLRTEVYVVMPDLPQVPGDVIDVVVVDTGNPESLGAYINSATIGDSQVQEELKGSLDGLRVG